MVHRPTSILAASAALLLGAFVAGCGDDVGSLIPRDGSPHVDGTAPKPETQLSFPEAGHAPPDAGRNLDSVGVDEGAVEAAGEANPPPPGPDAGPEALPPPPVTVIVLPDTQYYASSYPAVFTAQTSWIAQQQPALNIALALHVGDIVDTSTSTPQWTVANPAMRRLDGIVPYVVVPGNHDTDIDRNGPINNYFGPASMPWIAGTMVAGQIENNYALVDIGPQQWLILGLEFGPRDAVMTWADAVLEAYPDRPAIILTHAYLYGDGNRYDFALSSMSHQAFIPQDYGYTASQGINDGEMIWQKLILTNANVRLVFSGHDSGAARLTSARPDGSVVHQMLSDYQWYNIDASDYYGGAGYLRVLQFDYGKKTIQVQTYSPYLDGYLTDAENQFSLSFEP